MQVNAPYYDLPTSLAKTQFFFRDHVLKRKPENMVSLLSLEQYKNAVTYISLSGTCLSPEFLFSHYQTLKPYTGRVIILGGGLSELVYGNEEAITLVRRALRALKVPLIVTRDYRSFEAIKDLPARVYPGIDCAYFLKDIYMPLPAGRDSHVIANFDSTAEPADLQPDLRTHHSIAYYSWTERLFGRRTENKHLQKPKTFISDIPEDYLNLYATAKEVHTDRVHTALVARLYETPVKMYGKTPRNHLFEKVDIQKDDRGFSRINMKIVRDLKAREIDFLRKNL